MNYYRREDENTRSLKSHQFCNEVEFHWTGLNLTHGCTHFLQVTESGYVILRNVIARGEFKGQLLLTLGLVSESSSSPTVKGLGTRDTETKLAACLVNARGLPKRSNLEEREWRTSVVMVLYQHTHCLRCTGHRTSRSLLVKLYFISTCA